MKLSAIHSLASSYSLDSPMMYRVSIASIIVAPKIPNHFHFATMSMVHLPHTYTINSIQIYSRSFIQVLMTGSSNWKTDSSIFVYQSCRIRRCLPSDPSWKRVEPHSLPSHTACNHPKHVSSSTQTRQTTMELEVH